jgi:NTP pyrophosphatase (non-canonical NTP hydrolase)
MKHILQSIKDERARQIAKWGDNSETLSPLEYLPILGEEYGEVCRAVHDAYFAERYPDVIDANPGDYEHAKKELVHVAAVCVAMIQCIEHLQKSK